MFDVLSLLEGVEMSNQAKGFFVELRKVIERKQLELAMLLENARPGLSSSRRSA
jgi:hypothetical protein